MPTSPTPAAPHKAKVCSVLLPIYSASDAQSKEVFKGYDKITTSPSHKWQLPRWNVSPEKVAKYASTH